MDQTSIYLDPKLTRTFAERGSRRVEAVTAGQEKTRISVALTASAAGDKAPCLVLIPRKKPLKDFVCPANIVIVYGTKGNFNSQVMVENFMPAILDPYIVRKRLNKLYLLLDQAPCHLTAQVQAAFQQRPIKHKYVTKRGTNMLQPADVAWMHVFKLGYFNKWQQWMINEPKSFTPAGNLRSPGYAKTITWISEIWSAFDRNILARSFDQCGITSSSLVDLHAQLRTFVSTSKFVDTVEQANEEEVEALFTAPRDGDALDESFAELDMDDETESENERVE